MSKTKKILSLILCAVILFALMLPVTLCKADARGLVDGGGSSASKNSGSDESVDVKEDHIVGILKWGASQSKQRSVPGRVLAIANVLAQILRWGGVLLLAISVGMLVLSFKNEDAEGKIRYSGVVVVSIVLIVLPAILNAIVSSL